MASGFFALLDDVAVIAKAAASSLDDTAAMATKAGSKALGVVIDDAAVTPRYVVGIEPKRELNVIWRIVKGSLINKIAVLLPIALLLSSFAPFAIVPILMIGGFYLCFEGAEKIVEYFSKHHEEETDVAQTPEEFENNVVKSAIRTDIVLSAEIMAMALATVVAETSSFFEQVIVLLIVALGMTVGVYGAVALIVKADDFGMYLAKFKNGLSKSIGNGIVKAMPGILTVISVIGVFAMLMVGGGILMHSLHHFGLNGLEYIINDLVAITETSETIKAVLHPVFYNIFAIFFATVAGISILSILHLVQWLFKKK